MFYINVSQMERYLTSNVGWVGPIVIKVNYNGFVGGIPDINAAARKVLHDWNSYVLFILVQLIYLTVLVARLTTILTRLKDRLYQHTFQLKLSMSGVKLSTL